MMTVSDEKEFKDIIHALLCSLSRRTSEKELRKAFREQEGQNINNILESLYGPKYTLYGFLRYKCSEFCDTYRLDGEVKIEKFTSESTKHIEKMTKSRHKNASKRPAPKLNYPISHLRVKSSHANPQGFSKVKTSLPNYGDPFYEAPNAKKPEEDAEFVLTEQKKITLANFLDIDVSDEENDPNNAIINGNIEEVQPSCSKFQPQSVFDFPQLTHGSSFIKKDSRIGISGQTNPYGTCNYSTLIAKFNQSSISSSNSKKDQKVLRSIPQPIPRPVPNTKVVREAVRIESFSSDSDDEIFQYAMKKSLEDEEDADEIVFGGAFSEISPVPEAPKEAETTKTAIKEKKKEEPAALNFNDPLLFIDYPEVAMDASHKIISTRIKKFPYKLQFPINITTTFSPSQFYFQCDDESLREMMGLLQTFYESIPSFGLQIGISNLHVGQIVGAKMDGIWYRAEVLSVGKEGRVDLLFVDFGMLLTRPIVLVRYLPLHFFSTPVKANKGCLFGIDPDNTDQWSDSARNFFFLKIKDKLLHASIRSSNNDEFYYLEIVDDLLSEQTIADQMIENYCGKKKEVPDQDTFPYAALLPY